MSSAVGIRAVRRNKGGSKATEGAHAAERRFLELSIPSHISNYFSGIDLPERFNPCDGKYVNLCLETNICDAADSAYKAIAKSGRFKSTCQEGMVAEDILLVIGILRSIRMKDIPQEFAPGILLMHLEFLEDITFPTEI